MLKKYMKEFIIDNSQLEIKTLYNIINNGFILKLSKESLNNVNDCRDYLDKKINLMNKHLRQQLNL